MFVWPFPKHDWFAHPANGNASQTQSFNKFNWRGIAINILTSFPLEDMCRIFEKQMIYANAGFNSNHLMIIRAEFLVLAHGPIWNLHPCFPRCVFSSLFYLLWVKTIKVKNILVELSYNQSKIGLLKCPELFISGPQKHKSIWAENLSFSMNSEKLRADV